MEYTLSIKEFIDKARTKGVLLGIDHGTRRIGISISDPKREFTFPLLVLEGQDIKAIIKIIKEKNVSGLVIGYPLQLDGTEGAQCKIIKNFAKILLENTSIPIFFQDERFSTRGAQTMLRELGINRAKRDKIDDALSACNILQTAMNMLKNL